VNNQLFYQSENRPGSNSDKPWTDFPSAPRAPLHQFLDAVAGAKDQPLVSPREASARVTVMESMYTAAHDRKWVSIT
jgi:predicted dehydrogenase